MAACCFSSCYSVAAPIDNDESYVLLVTKVWVAVGTTLATLVSATMQRLAGLSWLCGVNYCRDVMIDGRGLVDDSREDSCEHHADDLEVHDHLTDEAF